MPDFFSFFFLPDSFFDLDIPVQTTANQQSPTESHKQKIAQIIDKKRVKNTTWQDTWQKTSEIRIKNEY